MSDNFPLITYQLTDRLMRLIRREGHSSVERLADEPQALSEGVPRVFFVDSGSARAASTNNGLEPLNPFATLAQAIGAALADRGDVIVLAAGHAESPTGAIAVNKSGITIVGIGNGRNRPSFTPAGAVDILNVTSANVKIHNLNFVAPTAAATAYINVDAADVEVSDCEFECDADTTDVITITANGDRAFVHDCLWRITANGPTSGVVIEAAGTDGVRLKNLRSHGGSVANAWDNGFIYSTSAHTGCMVEDIYNDFGPTVIFTGAATGLIKDVWPGEISETASGYQLRPGACNLVGGPAEGYRINRATADINTAAAVDLLTVAGGRILLKALLAEVTTVLSAGTTPDLKFQSNPTIGTTTDLCATLNVASDEQGSLYSITGAPATALVRGESGSVALMSASPGGVVIPIGAIEAINDEDITGSIKIALWVKQVDPGARWVWT